VSRTSTTYVSFDSLKASGGSACTVVKLMMACNDMSLANQALTEWKKYQPRNKKSRQKAAGMYFVRTQLAHLHEGFKVLDAMRADNALMAHLESCDKETKKSFQNLISFLHGGANHDEFERLVGRVRHNLTFHYDESGKMIEKALADGGNWQSSITRASTAHLWHFKIADDIVDSIVVRQIWKIPKSADTRNEADKIADRIHQIFLWYVDFAGEFIWRYCKK
jgi:YD repeat-containing protein